MKKINENTKVTLTLGQLKRLVRESIMSEANVGKNEHEVAVAIYNALNRHFGNLPGMLVDGSRKITYNGVFYDPYRDGSGKAIAGYKVPKLLDDEFVGKFDKTSKSMKPIWKKNNGDTVQPDNDDDTDIIPHYSGSGYGPGNRLGGGKLAAIKWAHLGNGRYGENQMSWAVFETGSLNYPGDIAVIMSEANSDATSSTLDCVSVIEVKRDSFGDGLFNPSFSVEEIDGVYQIIPTGRYNDIWFDVIDEINEELSAPEIQEKIKSHTGTILYRYPLDVDFDSFLSRWAGKNPFGPIEWLAMGKGEDVKDLSFYKLSDNPIMNLFGTGQAGRLSKRRSSSVGSVFNSVFLSLNFRKDRKGLAGHVDFGAQAPVMVEDPDLGISFKNMR